MSMDRHLTLYELVETIGGRTGRLADGEYVQSHAVACAYCGSRLARLVNPLVLGFHEKVPSENTGGETFGYFYLPKFDPQIHRMPPAASPLIAVSNPYDDFLTGIPAVRVMLTHGFTDLCAERDLVCESGNGRFDGMVICLWSEMEVPLTAIDPGSPLGSPGIDTWSAVKGFCDNTPMDPDQHVSVRPVFQGTPQALLRKQLLADHQELADDLFRRRDTKIRAIDALEGRLPENISLIGNDRITRLSDALFALVKPSQTEVREAEQRAAESQPVGMMAAVLGSDAFESTAYRSRCSAEADERSGASWSAVVRCLLECEQYIRFGARELRRQAELSIEQLRAVQ